MVSFYDPDEVSKNSRTNRKQALERQKKRREWAASLEGEEGIIAAKEAALKQLDRQDRSRAELYNKLELRGFSASSIDAALERLEAAGLVDDERYARMLVRTRFNERGLVGKALVRQLLDKQIPSQIIDLAMQEIEGVSLEECARQIALRKVCTMKGADKQAQFRRLASMLARKGYPSSVCYAVVREVLEQLDE